MANLSFPDTDQLTINQWAPKKRLGREITKKTNISVIPLSLSAPPQMKGGLKRPSIVDPSLISAYSGSRSGGMRNDGQ